MERSKLTGSVVAALELDPVCEGESLGLGVALVAVVERTIQPERRQRPVRRPERRVLR